MLKKIVASVLLLSVLALPLQARTIPAPAAPPALQPPSGQTLLFALSAKGVQIYSCEMDAAHPGAYGWQFIQPEAQLSDARGRVVAKHYAGPTWESTDGSQVVGEVRAHLDSPDRNAVPWLLLAAKSNSGSGAFAAVRSIQRLRTSGGLAPAGGCKEVQAQQMLRVPYTATYYFYGSHP